MARGARKARLPGAGRNHGGRQHQVRVAAHILAEQADAFIQGTADDGPAVGIIALLLALVPAVLGAHYEALALAEQDHTAVGLREQTQQVFEEAVQQRLHLQRPTEVLGEGHRVGHTWEGRLILKGFGDPALASSNLRQLVSILWREGIRNVTGGIVWVKARSRAEAGVDRGTGSAERARPVQ